MVRRMGYPLVDDVSSAYTVRAADSAVGTNSTFVIASPRAAIPTSRLSIATEIVPIEGWHASVSTTEQYYLRENALDIADRLAKKLGTGVPNPSASEDGKATRRDVPRYT